MEANLSFWEIWSDESPVSEIWNEFILFLCQWGYKNMRSLLLPLTENWSIWTNEVKWRSFDVRNTLSLRFLENLWHDESEQTLMWRASYCFFFSLIFADKHSPFSVRRSTSTVGFPRESKISLATMLTIDILRDTRREEKEATSRSLYLSNTVCGVNPGDTAHIWQLLVVMSASDWSEKKEKE